MTENQFAKCPRCNSENVQAGGYALINGKRTHMQECKHCGYRFKDTGKPTNKRRYRYRHKHCKRCEKEVPRGTGHRTSSKRYVYCE